MGGVSKITVRTTRHITFARVRAPRPGRSVVGSGASFSSSDASGSTLGGLAGPSAPSPSSSLDSVSDDSSSESSFFRLLPFVLGRLCKRSQCVSILSYWEEPLLGVAIFLGRCFPLGGRLTFTLCFLLRCHKVSP